jgi:predicted TIM-barrel enzyme
VTTDTVADLLKVADGVIVGTDTKIDGKPTNPVDLKRASAVITAATS